MKILFYEWHGPLSHWCREGKTLVVRPLKKNTFLCEGIRNVGVISPQGGEDGQPAVC